MSMQFTDSSSYINQSQPEIPVTAFTHRENWWQRRTDREQKLIIAIIFLSALSFVLFITVIILGAKLHNS
ncbi:unnamed protein product [Oppiella nova]|uniref:Uncharacterized protein n=1 Tax=Oppiella nova TaxID=334625 RepID=A0A7R9MEM5_9ACAR|nr:unnamed protein product [Oppiella nova]CAG2175971.1 unnamed protein product [Oppiella nova]